MNSGLNSKTAFRTSLFDAKGFESVGVSSEQADKMQIVTTTTTAATLQMHEDIL